MTHTHSHVQPSERLPLIAAAALVVFAVCVIFMSRATSIGQQELAPVELTDTRSLLFNDIRNGLVTIDDATTGDRIAEYDLAEGGFVRTALRALGYSRRLNRVDMDRPLTLGRTATGRLYLQDPSTEKLIWLDAFGEANADQFATLLDGMEKL